LLLALFPAPRIAFQTERVLPSDSAPHGESELQQCFEEVVDHLDSYRQVTAREKEFYIKESNQMMHGDPSDTCGSAEERSSKASPQQDAADR
jgi:hypothetical protein